ncbi:MAG: exonuclease domain-containing protein [Caldisericaceae bacterium]
MSNRILIFFDLETTGLDADSDDVIEIGAIKTSDGEVIEKFHSLVKPRKGLTKFITNLTGITEEDLKDAKEAEQIKESISNFINNYPLIAHNASFDKMFLEKLLSRPLQNPVFDTLELARIFFPDMASHSLQNLVRQLSIKDAGPHRALGDTEMLLDLYRKIVAEKENFPAKLLKVIRETVIDTDYSELFGDDWDFSNNDEDFTLFGTYTAPELVLPFNESSEHSQFESGVFYIESDSSKNAIDEAYKIAKSGRKVVISFYSTDEIDYAAQKFKAQGFDVEKIVQIEGMLCPKKIQFFMEHREYIPRAFRSHFAILVSYLYKTKNLVVTDAPTHILKNPLVKVFSSCDEPLEKCEFENQCPFFNKRERLSQAQVVLTSHQFIVKDSFFNSVFASSSLIVVDAFRLPKIVYNARISYSLEELEMILKYYGGKSDSEQLLRIVFERIENTESKDFSKEIEALRTIFSGIKNEPLRNFFIRDSYYIDRRGSRTSIVASNERPENLFRKVNSTYSSILFFSPKNTIEEVNIIEEFTGLDGKLLTIGVPNEHKNVISIVPLYLSPSYNGSFMGEFVDFFSKVHREGYSSAIIFNQQTLLKEVYFEMKNRGVDPKAIGIDLAQGSSKIDLFLYDYPFQKDYDEVFFVKLPSIQSENYINESFEYFSAIIIRNVAETIVQQSENPKIFFYFDSKLKREDFRAKFEELFVTFPLFLEKEESVLRMLTTWSARHISNKKDGPPFKEE